MASGTFQQNSLDWQVQQITQRVGEWFERLLGNRLFNEQTQASQPPEWLLKAMFWLIVVGAVAWASWQLYQLLRPYWMNYWQTNQNPDWRAVPPTWQTPTEWLRQARTAQQQGNYREACRALYMAMLQQLHDRGIIPEATSRTDGEYLALIQSLNLPSPCQALIQTHERICFDRVNVSSEMYDRCWQAYQEIERL